MIRKPESIKKGDTIGITAPSFGAATEPYSVLIDMAIDKIQKRGYEIVEGKTARMGDGKGISTDPKVCARELMEFYNREDIDAIISAGGGELMNETIANIDFKELRKSKPKWFIGYSDNTNFIFPLVTIADTMGIYGPCISGYAKKWEDTELDAFALLEGTRNNFSGYDKFVSYKDDSDEETVYEYSPDEVYDLGSDKILFCYDCSNHTARKVGALEEINMEGILLGGCLDVLANLVGTRFDNMAEFKKKYSDIVWVLECCDLSVMSYRRAIWNLREAGWFDRAKGFIIGRARACHGQEFTGVDEYNAVTDVLEGLGAPIIMDADIGHIDPMLPIVMGATAKVNALGNLLNIEYL